MVTVLAASRCTKMESRTATRIIGSIIVISLSWWVRPRGSRDRSWPAAHVHARHSHALTVPSTWHPPFHDPLSSPRLGVFAIGRLPLGVCLPPPLPLSFPSSTCSAETDPDSLLESRPNGPKPRGCGSGWCMQSREAHERTRMCVQPWQPPASNWHLLGQAGAACCLSPLQSSPAVLRSSSPLSVPISIDHRESTRDRREPAVFPSKHCCF